MRHIPSCRTGCLILGWVLSSGCGASVGSLFDEDLSGSAASFREDDPSTERSPLQPEPPASDLPGASAGAEPTEPPADELPVSSDATQSVGSPESPEPEVTPRPPRREPAAAAPPEPPDPPDAGEADAPPRTGPRGRADAGAGPR